MRYHLKERFLTLKDDFVVRNDNKQEVFDVKGSIFHIGDHLHIFDHASGHEVFSIKEKLFTHTKEYTFYQNGSQVATIRKTNEPLFALNYFEVDCASGAVLQLRGDFKEWDFSIADQYARIYGHINKEFALFTDYYVVDVPDGI